MLNQENINLSPEVQQADRQTERTIEKIKSSRIKLSKNYGSSITVSSRNNSQHSQTSGKSPPIKLKCKSKSLLTTSKKVKKTDITFKLLPTNE